MNTRDRIIAALAAIDTAKDTPTSARSIIGELYKHCGRRLSWPDLPVTVHEHARNADFATAGMSKWLLFYHHAGSVIKSYQERVALGDMVDLDPHKGVQIRRAEETLERRLTVLELLVLTPLKGWKIAGSDSAGWHLEV